MNDMNFRRRHMTWGRQSLTEPTDDLFKTSFLEKDIRYSPNVLTGNWYNSRIGKGYYQSRAIAPGIMDSDCTKENTEYKRNFQPFNVEQKTLARNFLQWKEEGIHNRFNSLKSQSSICDSQSYQDNFTTTTSIFFDLKPKEDTRRGKISLQKVTQEDYLQNYGNKSNYGLCKYIKCKQQTELCAPKDVSTYKDTFKLPQFRI